MKRISHYGHEHPDTGHYRSRCRDSILAGDGPLIVTRSKRGKKRVSTLKEKRAQEQTQVEAVEAILDATEPVEEASAPARDEKGRFAHLTLDEWRSLIESLESAEAWLTQNATLVRAEIEVTVAGADFVATFNGSEWSVGAK